MSSKIGWPDTKISLSFSVSAQINFFTSTVCHSSAATPPPSPTSLKSLEELAINDNLLECLPDSIGRLEKLQTLILDCNLLTRVPVSITNCSQLRLLSLAENRLSELPEEIGMLNNLKVLNLSGNDLESLPASLVNIPLSALWLSDNQRLASPEP